ncbi:MAG: hypothetical protein WEC99_04890 [Halofilum sp. (in: g-proteobacteria)]
MNSWTVSFVVWGALLLLLAASTATAVLVAGPMAHAFSLASALAMAALIVTWFMGLRTADGLLRVFALAAVFWLALLIALTLADFLTR